MMNFLRGFIWAAKGVGKAALRERNLRFHLCAAAYVLAFSAFYSFSALHYAAIVLLICGVLALELVNSAVERVVDAFCPRRSAAAAYIKDTAAGAVLVFCAGAACCGALLFWDVDVFYRIYGFFIARPLMTVLLAVSLAASAWFVFGIKSKRDEA